MPLYAYSLSNYGNQLFITEPSKKKIRRKLLAETDQIYISLDMSYSKDLDVLSFFFSLSLDAIS